MTNAPKTVLAIHDLPGFGRAALSVIVPVLSTLGVQTVADLANVPVFTATNSLNYVGHHGMALTQKTCGACAQC